MNKNRLEKAFGAVRLGSWPRSSRFEAMDWLPAELGSKGMDQKGLWVYEVWAWLEAGFQAKRESRADIF